MATRRIGIIGDGNVGGALARGLERAGHDVRAVGKDRAAIRIQLGYVLDMGTQLGSRRIHEPAPNSSMPSPDSP